MSDTIQELIDALAGCDQDASVYVDNRPPTALSSYRGYYDQLAIERTGAEHEATELDEPGEGFGRYQPGSSEVRIKQPPTVADLTAALRLAIGATFEGYKGGQFTMTGQTAVWVSEYGQCDRLQVAAVKQLPGRVELLTTEQEW